MKPIQLTQEEKRAAAQWAADESWVKQKRYQDDKDYMECVADIMADPIFQSMDRFIQHGSTTCKSHCIQVSYMSYALCRKFGWSYREAARAGLLHDLFLYDWHTHARETGNHFHGYTHPRVAMNNASRYFKLTDTEKDMILRHMWPLTPVPPKTKEAFSIIYSDKFCGLVEVGANMKGWVMSWKIVQNYIHN